MKKIIYIILVACLLTGCEDFLDTANKTKKDSTNFPRTENDASQLLTGAYAIVGRPEPLGSLFLVSELMSDDRFGGGGTDDTWGRAIDQFKKNGDNSFNNSWRAHYFGVFRCNYLITSLNLVDWKSDLTKTKITGEVHFLRAHFYFDLIRMFGEVPLLTSPEPVNIPQNPASEVYAQIASDLKIAIESLPDTKFQDIDRSSDLGRATKWAAESLMARVFLFYTGYYEKETLPLAEGGEITKEQVVEWLVDCIENSGHDLVDDFRNLWTYSYVKDYKFTADNNLQWEGDGNKESVFMIKYSALANWDHIQQKSNQFALYFGLRGQSNYANTFPFGKGWGFGTVNPKIWDDWDDNDLRKKSSMFYALDTDEISSYGFASDNIQDHTLYWQKKYMPTNVWKNAAKDSVHNFSHEINNGMYDITGENVFQRENIQDLVLIRFSDVLLMAAELGAPDAQNYLNRIRTRVGLGSVPITLDNIKAERRFELAFEGVRYYDLLRWHDEHLITENQTDIVTYNRRGQQNTQRKTVTFRPETRGFLPIPQTQIDLSGGVLMQNPGWEGSDHYLN